MSGFSLIVRKSVNMGQQCEKEITQSLTKEEIIQQIRTNFAIYTEYTPSTSMIMEKMGQHLTSCSSLNHSFFEVEPICSILWSGYNGEINLQRDLFKAFHFMKHLSTYGKKMFLNKHLFDLANLDGDSFRFWLDPPHFESNVDKLLSCLNGTGFARDIILKKYKQHLKQHLNECNGPCKLNMFGVPICKKKKCEIESLDKMFYGFHLFLKSETTVQLKQILFDMIYESKQYDNLIEFIVRNAVRNPTLQKILE